MALRTNNDYLAESGLEHARALILKPHDVSGEYWQGAGSQQIIAGSNDYYDVNVTEVNNCDYTIDCTAYRQVGSEQKTKCRLIADLRLDPAIALWTSASTWIPDIFNITGDVRCGGTLNSDASIDGDIFASSFNGTCNGQINSLSSLSLSWPNVTITDFTTKYPVQTITSSALSNQTLGPYSPTRVFYRNGDLKLQNVIINGMLIVNGDLTINGASNRIIAPKNLPALLVIDDLIVENSGGLDVNGLVVVYDKLEIYASSANFNISGAIFSGDDIAYLTEDSSGNGRVGQIYSSPVFQPSSGQLAGAIELDGTNDKIENTNIKYSLNGLSEITVSLWVKSDVTGQDRGIFFSREPYSSYDRELGLRYDKNGLYGGGVNNIKASIRTTVGYEQIESSSSVQTTGWQHLAISWKSGTSMKLYINGVEDTLSYDRGAIGGTINYIDKFMLGCGTYGNYWDGMIDDVRIYNRQLDPNEIYPPHSGVSGLIAHWAFDEQGTSDITITAAPAKASAIVWSGTGQAQDFSPAADAFFRRIERQ
jgi:hypothetical protein